MTTSNNKLPKPDMAHPIHFMAFGFGAGCSPKAPGTMGTLMAVALYLPLSLLPLNYYLLVTLAVTLTGIGLCGWSANKLGVHDHPGIVWDEIAGYLITMVAAPKGWLWIFIGFVLFRFFDILKPWPISYLDRRVSGGFGIMLDDIVAGLAALACVQLVSQYKFIADIASATQALVAPGFWYTSL
jgi:phosphatidylglycerophosphatase A